LASIWSPVRTKTWRLCHPFCMQRRFHLHRFDGEQHVAGLDRLAGRNGDCRDDARHRRADMSGIAGFGLAADRAAGRAVRPVRNLDAARLAVQFEEDCDLPLSSATPCA
jgi:hypothetical protein